MAAARDSMSASGFTRPGAVAGGPPPTSRSREPGATASTGDDADHLRHGRRVHREPPSCCAGRAGPASSREDERSQRRGAEPRVRNSGNQRRERSTRTAITTRVTTLTGNTGPTDWLRTLPNHLTRCTTAETNSARHPEPQSHQALPPQKPSRSCRCGSADLEGCGLTSRAASTSGTSVSS
jgi:hypothetical protein